MSTNQQTVDRAAQELGYIGKGEALDATDAADAMRALNEMMHQWKEESKDFNWFTQDTLGDTTPLPKWAQGPVQSCLGLRLSSVFDISPSAQLVQDAAKGERVIANRLINESLRGADMSHLPLGTGRTRWNIETDS